MTKNIKKYETPEMKVIEMETAPLLAGSGGEIKAEESEDGTWN